MVDFNAKYTVIYRTGGTHKFNWHKTFSVGNRRDALILKDKLNHQGFRATVHQKKQLDVVGLPSTFAPSKTDNQSHLDLILILFLLFG